jgi:hypothetical protein
MARGLTLEPEERAIERWTVHCPACGAEAEVPPTAAAVACPSCHSVFRPEGTPTSAGAAARRPEPADASDSLVGTSLGRWRLERIIGRGGMGRVYEAVEDGGERRVALKVLPDDLAADPAFVRRFHREAKLLSSLSHPHVVEVLDQGGEGGRLWFAMEYVRGENLRRRIERGPLPAAEAGRIALEIASALSYAHERDVIHRDLKPENVLLDEEGRVHLADFGLSRLVRPSAPEATTRLTRTDVILGTYEYMAPEQRRGAAEADGRADVFALGVILYEMLVGTLPVGRFAPPSHVARGVSPAVDAVVNRALATDPKDRYANARDLQDALRAALTASSGPEPSRTEPVPEPESEEALVEARGVLRHVDVLSGLDRALGILLLAGSVVPILGAIVFWPKLGGLFLPLVVAGIVFMRLGSRIRAMGPESREAQVTASVVLLFFPPFATAMGIYGLVVLTSDRARRAFELGRAALEGPRPLYRPAPPPVVHVVPRAPRRDSWVLLRLLAFASVLWTVYCGFVTLDVLSASFRIPRWAGHYRYEEVVDWSLAGTVVAAAAFLLMWSRRRERRGLGLAVVALVLFATDWVVLSGALHRAERLAAWLGP